MAVLEQTAVLTDAIRPVPASELEARLEKFRRLMDEMLPVGRWLQSIIRLQCIISRVRCRKACC